MAKKKEIELDLETIQKKARMEELYEERMERVARKAERKAILDELFRRKTEQVEDKDVCDDVRIRQIDEELIVLMDEVPRSETKTRYKVSLLCGDVILNKAYKDFDKDVNKLLQWALENNITEFVKIKQEFDWAKFKSMLTITGDGTIIINDTGEVVEIDGLGVIEVPEKLVIK